MEEQATKKVIQVHHGVQIYEDFSTDFGDLQSEHEKEASLPPYTAINNRILQEKERAYYQNKQDERLAQARQMQAERNAKKATEIEAVNSKLAAEGIRTRSQTPLPAFEPTQEEASIQHMFSENLAPSNKRVIDEDIDMEDSSEQVAGATKITKKAPGDKVQYDPEFFSAFNVKTIHVVERKGETAACKRFTKDEMLSTYSSLNDSVCEFDHVELAQILSFMSEYEDLHIDIAVAYLNNFIAIVSCHPPVFIHKRLVNGEVHNDLVTEGTLHSIYKPHTISVRSGKSRSSKKVFELWTDHVYRRTYKKIDFNPNLPSNHPEIFNLYRGNQYTREFVATADPSLAKPFDDHIRHIWCKGDEKIYNYTIRLLAYFFQFPHVRPDVAIILQSEQGAGKTSIVDLYGKLFAPHYKVADGKRSFGQFNASILREALLVLLDETAITSNAALDTFKSYITSNKVRTEEKYQAQVEITNYTRWILATNREHSKALVTSDNRRFFVLGLADTFVGKAKEKATQDYFDVLVNTPLASLANFLYSFDLRDFNYRGFPETEALMEMKKQAMDSVAEFWFWCLRNERIGLDDYFAERDDNYKTNNAHPYNRFNTELDKSLVFLAYRHWCEQQGIPTNKMKHEAQFWKQLLDYCGTHYIERQARSFNAVSRKSTFSNVPELKLMLAKKLRNDQLFADDFDDRERQPIANSADIQHDLKYIHNFLQLNGVNPQEAFNGIYNQALLDIEPEENLMYQPPNEPGKLVTLPRRKAFYSEYVLEQTEAGPVQMAYLYHYGNLDANGKPYEPKPKPFTNDLNYIRGLIGKHYSSPPPNHCVLNIYRDGNDSIGEHHDKTVDWVENSPVCTISLGAVRIMKLIPAVFGKLPVDISLQAGSLITIGRQSNEYFRHSIPKQEMAFPGVRVSLTFRWIKTKAPLDSLGVHQQ